MGGRRCALPPNPPPAFFIISMHASNTQLFHAPVSLYFSFLLLTSPYLLYLFIIRSALAFVLYYLYFFSLAGWWCPPTLSQLSCGGGWWWTPPLPPLVRRGGAHLPPTPLVRPLPPPRAGGQKLAHYRTSTRLNLPHCISSLSPRDPPPRRRSELTNLREETTKQNQR